MSILPRSDVRAVREFTCPHAPQQVEILLDRAIAVAAVRPRRCHGSARGPDLRVGLRIDVGAPLLHQQLAELVEPLEVVACVKLLVPLEAEPADVVLERLDVLHVFAGRIRVVEAKIAAPAELVADAEVHADRFDVTDVRKPVRLGRKPCRDLASEAVGRDVFGDHVANEVATRRGRRLNVGSRRLAYRGRRIRHEGRVAKSVGDIATEATRKISTRRRGFRRPS